MIQSEKKIILCFLKNRKTKISDYIRKNIFCFKKIHMSLFTWPDPRAKWPDSAKASLQQILLKGRPKREEQQQQQQQSQNASSTSISSSYDSLLSNSGLMMGSSDYNFTTKSIPNTTNNSSKSTTQNINNNNNNHHPVASVAAFLTHAATTMLATRQNHQEVYQDECALMFLADVLEVSCGPGGVASVKLNFPPTDPGGVNFYKSFAAANGARVESVNSFLHGGGMNQTTAAAFQQIMMATNNNLNGVSNTNSISNNDQQQQQQMAVSSSICIVADSTMTTTQNNQSGGTIVVDRCGGDAQLQAIHFHHQSVLASVGAAGARRQRGSAGNNNNATTSNLSTGSSDNNNNNNNKDPTSILFGYFAATSACSTCPSDNLKALLCRRPTLHQLPCSVLFILFASLQQILDQYDALREQPPAKTKFVGIVKPEITGVEAGGQEGQQQVSTLSARSLPSGIPFAMKLFCGESVDGTYSWFWLWNRVCILNKILFEGIDTFAKVV